MKTLLMLIITMISSYPKSVHDYSFTSIDGKVVNLKEFKGKRLLIINTASKCGFTKQYKEPQELEEKYGDKVVVIGFPSDNFGGQEFEDNKSVKEFCQENYGVSFLLADKSNVKGDKASPLFKYLTTESNQDFEGAIKWNFEKFVVDENGQLIHRFRSRVSPMDPQILKALGVAK